MTGYKRIPNIEIEDAEIPRSMRNFRGDPDVYTPKGGVRQFVVVIPPEMGETLQADGWNVKFKEPYEEGDDPRWTLRVAVRFDNFPPNVNIIVNGRPTQLTEENVGLLDSAEIVSADIIISPSTYDVNGKVGVKAYLKELWATLHVSRFEAKHAKYAAPADETA